MGSITCMEAFRAQREEAERAALRRPITITRTPELAIIMALVEQLPRKYVGPAMCRVMQMAERAPDCAASQEAAKIAALLTLARGDR